MINYDNAATALKYLINTDEELARAKTLYDALCEQRKTIRAMQFLKVTGSAAERTERALASDEYQSHLQAISDSQIEFETLRNKRLTNSSIIEMWRSVNSAMKMGNV